MRERDVITGIILGSIFGFWVAQYISTLPSWLGNPILANCSDPTYCIFVVPLSIAVMLILISLVIYEILTESKRA